MGTGRLAIPLAARGVDVVGLDSSAGMLSKLSGNDETHSVRPVLGDMVDDQPDGPFGVVFVAFNTFFNLLTQTRQQSCFAAVSQRLVPGGAFGSRPSCPNRRPVHRWSFDR